MVVPSGTLELTEDQLWFAERQPTGFLVALWLDESTAEKLALPSGEPASNLHITLAYCGDASEMDELQQARIITAIDDAVKYHDRLEGVISGYGRFSATESSDGQDVFYATPDIPRLAELRQSLINRLYDQGVSISTTHGFSPHITLAYLDSDAENPVDELESLPLKFDGVTIMSGTRRIDIPFWTPEPTISMSQDEDLPLDAPLGSNPARALYFGSFDKEWIPFLPKPGKYVHTAYGELDFTSDTYDQILTNFNNYVFKQDLPIRATHMPSDGGAVGWIKPGGMRLAEDGSIEVKPEWNELGRGLVEDDRFKYASAEYCRVWTNPVTQERISNVVVGLALVTRPHFKTDVLNPLSESEAQAFADVQSGVAGKGIQMSDNQNPVIPPTTPAVPETPVVAPVTPLDTQQVVLSDLTQVVLTAEQRVKERQMFVDLNSRVELAERRASTAEAELKRLNTERRREKFTAEVMGRSSENGQPWFGNIQQNVDQLVSLAETYGDDAPEVRWSVTQKRNEAAAIKNTGIFDPISLSSPEDGPSVTAHVAHLADQLRSANPNLTLEAATTKVYEENPELYTRSLK